MRDSVDVRCCRKTSNREGGGANLLIFKYVFDF